MTGHFFIHNLPYMQLKNYFIGVVIILITLCAVYLPFSKTQMLSVAYTYPADVNFRNGLNFLSHDSLQKAEDAFKKAIFYQPIYAPPHYFLAQVYTRQEKLTQAIAEYQYTIKIDPESYPAYYNLGVLLRQLGEYNKAITLLKRATVLNPDYQAAYEELAQLYIQIGDFRSAEQIYELLHRLEKYHQNRQR